MTRVPEHDALVASTDVKITLANVHTTCNVRALLVDAQQYLAVLVIQSLDVNAAQVVGEVVESDVLYCGSLASLPWVGQEQLSTSPELGSKRRSSF